MVNVGERETRIAVMEDSRLVELHIEREERVVGSLYKARVSNVLQGMDAAFVDCGLDRNAFLYVGDVLPAGDTEGGAGGSDTALVETEEDVEGSDEPSGRARRPAFRRSVLRRQKIRDVLKIGQEILVQVIKGPRGTKGARVSTRISLPGRYLVLMPEADNVGISRKIEDNKERDRLKKIGDKLREPGFGIILRTEAEDKTEADLKADKDFLMKLWRQVQDGYRKHRAPARIHQDYTLVFKTIRDVFGSDVDRLVLDDAEEFEKANELLEMVSPRLRNRLNLYTGEKPLFDQYNVEAEIERLMKRKVWLRSGGYLVFDETEAFTVIDVNTGKYVGGGSLSETIVKTNVDAAMEIARQLRLRDIGGIIVIDFIDMNNARDKQQVLKALEAALKRDRSRTKISSISSLGLVEMTRKRTGETITDFMTQPCEYCGGRGKLPSAESVSIQIEREVRRLAKDGKKASEAFLIKCHPDVAESLIGPDGETVDRLEREIEKAVYVRAAPEDHLEKYEILPGTMAELDRKYVPFKRAQVVECALERSLVSPEPGVVGWHDGFMLALNGKSMAGRTAGQRAKVRITGLHRSYAAAEPIHATHGRVEAP